MSRRTEAERSVWVANQRTGGARVTKVQRKRTVMNFVDWSFNEGILFNSIREAPAETVRAFMQHLEEEGLSNATRHNQLASIRRSMTALGANPNSLGITATLMGLPPRNRSGTKVPISDNDYEEALAKAGKLDEPGLAIVLKLERLLGHRGLEGVMSIPDMEKFALEAKNLASGSVSVTKGTKGGRHRITSVIKARALETLAVIRDALVFSREHGGFLIVGPKPGLKSARSKYHRLCRQVGLTGKSAPHSLRYSYVVEKIVELRDAGFNKTEATSLVAQFIGHGPSRARYITMVYGKTVVHTLPVERRKARLDRAIVTVNKIVEGSSCPPFNANSCT